MLPATRVGAVATNEQGRQLERARELGDRITLGAVDPVCTVVDAINGPDAAAQALACLHDLDLVAQFMERARRAEPGDAGADHEDASMPRCRPECDEYSDRSNLEFISVLTFEPSTRSQLWSGLIIADLPEI